MVDVFRRIGSVFLALALTATLFFTDISLSAHAVSENNIGFDNILDARPATVEEITTDMADEADALVNAYLALINSSVDYDAKKYIGEYFRQNFFYILEDVGVLVLQPVTGVFYYFYDGEFIVDDTHHKHGGGRGRRRATSDDAVMSGSDFSTFLDNYNRYNVPKNKDLLRLSYRNNSRYGGAETGTTNWRLSWFYEGNFCNQNWQEVYMCPFYDDGVSSVYYLLYQLHFYFKVTQDSEGNNVISLYAEVFDMRSGEKVVDEYLIDSNFAKNRYCDIGCYYDTRLRFSLFNSLSRYVNKQSSGDLFKEILISVGSDAYYLYNYDLSQSVQSTTVSAYFRDNYDTHKTGDYDDYGYVCSNSPLSYSFAFDTTKFADDDLVTLSGDSIYDYTITNNSTGDSTTINEYVTNNYTYPSSGTGGSGDSSGGSSGDIVVSGGIDVSGKVDVGVNVSPIDVNVNVNQPSGGSSSGGDVNDYIDVTEEINTNVDDYITHIPEVSKGFIDYLKGFFAWLPKEIYGLLILGLLVSVWCRINGR